MACKGFFVGVVHLDVAEKGEVVAGADAAEVGAKNFGEIGIIFEKRGVLVVGEELEALVFEERSLGRQLAGGFVFAGELAGFDFAGFDVGLVEGVDADDGAGDGSGDFPAEEFLAEVEFGADDDADDGMAGFFESGDGGVHRAVVFLGEAQIGEDAVVAVDGGLADFFAIDGDDAFADFAGGFGDELFEPRAGIGDAGGSEDGDFVAAVIGGDAENGAEDHAGIFLGSGGGAAGFDHFVGDLQEFRKVEAHDGAGNRAEVRERGVAAADTGNAGEDVAEAAVFRDLLHLGAGIGDGDEMAADFLVADLLADALVEILLEDVGLEGAAGFRRDDEECFLEVELFLDGLDLGGIGGIEHVEFGVAAELAEGQAEDFDAEAGAAHAEKHGVAEFGFLDFRGELLEVGDFFELLVDDGEPAEPLAFVGAGPEGRVLLPEARDLIIGFPVGEGGLHSFGESWGQLVGDFV